MLRTAWDLEAWASENFRYECASAIIADVRAVQSEAEGQQRGAAELSLFRREHLSYAISRGDGQKR